MDEKSFLDNKKNLERLIGELLIRNDLIETEKDSLIRVMEILDQYNYEDRLELKGLLSHTVVDSLQLDYSLAEKLIMFDKSIT